MGQERVRDQISKRICGRCRHPMPSIPMSNACASCRIEQGTGATASPMYQEGKAIAESQLNEQDLTIDVMSMFNNGENNAVDDDGDINMADLELTYPEVTDGQGHALLHSTQTSSRSHEESGIPERDSAIVPNPQSHRPIVMERTKLLRIDSSEVAPPVSVSSSKRPRPRNLLCSTIGCTGRISLESFATRCLACVRQDWILKRRASLINPDSKIGTGILKGVPSLSKQRPKKKMVSWADNIEQPPIPKGPGQIGSDRNTKDDWQKVALFNEIPISKLAVQDGHPIDTPTVLMKASLQSKHAIDTAMNIGPVGGSPHTGDTNPSSRGGGGCSSRFKEADATGESQRSKIDKAALRKGRVSPSTFVLGNTERNDDSIPVASMKEDRKDVERPKAPMTGESSTPGWGSELSDLSDSSDSQASSSASESHGVILPPTQSGLKIRIPARPVAVPSRICGSSQCRQLLANDYPWKSCVMCRARRRENQRKRQSVEGMHSCCDGELLQALNQGTPLADDLIRGPLESDEYSVSLVTGARLCSTRSCTYIIPPANEYRWKMCALCRLRSRERSMRGGPNQHDINGSPIPPEWKARAKEFDRILKAIEKFPIRHETGRCQSMDCGMLLETDSLVRHCKQCTAKRLWLVSHGSSRPNHPTKLRGPAPYAQYKCREALIVEFNQRLCGFLEAQSIFFLCKEADNRLKSSKTIFGFDAEYSTVALDFDIVGRKEQVDRYVLKLKGEIERMGQLRFSPKRLVSILEGGGIAERFICIRQVPHLQANSDSHQEHVSISTCMKNMQGELEIAVLADHSHRYFPGQRTIVRFRLIG
ncbi:hypothetical protein B0H34DRAFT_229740 [Crassisporium funariophilum]|nr:hypothetical protein B0H34DRAFT_229740 [Crassisporium funariophilum]